MGKAKPKTQVVRLGVDVGKFKKDVREIASYLKKHPLTIDVKFGRGGVHTNITAAGARDAVSFGQSESQTKALKQAAQNLKEAQEVEDFQLPERSYKNSR